MMKTLRVLLAATLLAGLAAAPVAAGPAPVQRPETYVHLVFVDDPQISPDGSRVAYAASDSLDPSLTQIWMVGALGSARPMPFTAGGRSAHAPRWSPDGRGLYFLSARADTASEQIQKVDSSGGESRPVTSEPRGVASFSISPDGRQVAYVTPMAANVGDPIDAGARGPTAVLRVLNLEDGATWNVSPDTANVWDFSWSPDGLRLAVLFTHPGRFGEWRRGRLAVIGADGQGWRRLPGRFDPTHAVAWSPDGSTLACYTLPAESYAYPVLHLIGVDGAGLRRLSAPELKETDEGVSWSRDGGLLVMSFAGVQGYLTRIDPSTGGRTRLVPLWSSPGPAGRAFSVSNDGAVAYLSEGIDHPADLYLYTPDGAGPLRLTAMNPQLTGGDFATPQPVTWTSFDGERIEGILFTPAAAFRRPVPLIVQPHGGPSWHWTLGFFADPHSPGLYLARQGYAVFYPNPRGSTGYGERFNALNRRDLGGGDFRDIEAGVDSLVKAGLADPGRMAVDGFSYGGFMTAWTVAHTHRYRCAVVGAGPVDFVSDYPQNDLTPYWQEEFLGGSVYDDLPEYLAHSVISYARSIRTPVLIVHGAEDVRVPLAQSRELYTALKEQGSPVELFIYPREGHGFREPAHQIDVMERQRAWFDRYLK